MSIEKRSVGSDRYSFRSLRNRIKNKNTLTTLSFRATYFDPFSTIGAVRGVWECTYVDRV